MSISELKRTTGVTDQQLDKEIEDKDFHMLAGQFDTLFGLLEELDLNPADRTNVKRRVDQESIQSGVALALRLWQSVNPSAATFKALVNILLRLRKGNVTVQICNYNYCKQVDAIVYCFLSFAFCNNCTVYIIIIIILLLYNFDEPIKR